MSLQFDGAGSVLLPGGGFQITPSTIFSWTTEVEYTGTNKLFAGNLSDSGPYIGFISGNIGVRMGATTNLSGASLVVGQFYEITISGDGAGNITISVPGVGTANGAINANVVFNVIGRYGGGTSFNFNGLIRNKMNITGVSVGDLRYNFEAPQGSSTLPEELQGLDGTLQNFTTGGFTEPLASDDPPVITILGNNPETITVGDTYNDAGATASDTEDGDLTGSITTTNNVDANTQGTYTVDYSVTDSGGNTTTASRTVNVEAVAGTPVITIESLVDGASKLQDVNEQATFTLSGSITDGTGPVEYQLDDGAWQVLDSGTGTTFTGTITVTRQQNVSVRLQNDVTVTDTVLYITAAERCIAITPAQSNGAGRGLNLQQPTWDPTKPRPTMYKHNEGFFPLEDPTSNDIDPALGSMWPWYAKRLSDAGIRVCFANVAAGGTRISQWLPGAQLYSKFQGFASAVGGVTDAFGIIGESDTLFDTLKADYKANYLTVVQDITGTYGANFYLTRFPLGPGVIDATNLQDIRDAMDELVAENAFINDGGDLGDIDLTGNEVYTGGSLHLVTDEQLIQGADIIYTAVEGVDVIAPIITLTGSATVTVTEGDVYNDAGATATDNIDGDITGNITVVNPVDTNTPGVYTVTYNVSDAAGNAADEVTRTVTVQSLVDTTPPVITLLGDANVTVNEGDTYTDAGATASDNVDGDITGSIVVTGTVDTSTPGVYTLNYDVSDAAGNAADTVTRTVTVVAAADTTPPVITLNGSATIAIVEGSAFTDPGATATDDTDGDITGSIVVSGSVDTGTPGTYVLSYNVQDAAGNAATTVTRTVTVTAAPSGDYDFTIPAGNVLIALSGNTNQLKWKEVKDPSDRVFLQVEIESAWLASESIVSATMTVDQASGLTLQDPGINGNKVRTFVTDGNVGSHDIEVTITTATRTIQRTVTLSVAER